MSTERIHVIRVHVVGKDGTRRRAFTDGDRWWVERDKGTVLTEWVGRPTQVRGEYLIYKHSLYHSNHKWCKKQDRILLRQVCKNEINLWRQ